MDIDKCREAAAIQTNPWFISLHCLVAILDVLGIALILFLLVSVFKTKIFHINLRILIVSFGVALILRSLQTFYRSGGFVITAATAQDDCDFLSDTFECLVVSVFGLAFVLTAFCSLLASALERMYACFRSKVYEKSNNPIIGIIFLFLSWTAVAYLIVRFLVGDEREEFIFQTVAFCNTGSVINITHFDFGVQILYVILLCAVAYFGLFLYTRKRKSHFSCENLSHRYQIVENLRATQVILPVAAGFLVPTIAVIGGNYALYFSGVDNPVHAAIYKELLSMTTPVYVVFFPLLFIRKCPELVRTWRTVRTPVVHVTHLQYGSSLTHFRQLETLWGSPSTRHVTK